MVRTKLKRERVDSPSSSKRLKTNSPTPSSVVIADPGYTVQYPTMAKQPHKLTQSDLDLIAQAERHRSPFLEDNDEDGSLDQDFVVTPYDSWRAMRQYNSFVIQEEKYYKHDYVFVKNDENAQPRNVNEKDFWVARILEIRGADASHVYALVNWMYWPDELPQTKAPHESAPSAGRRNYHGNRELLASNFMEVVDVLSCAGKAEVVHWKELDDEDQINTLYWRQTLCRQTGQLSAVRKHCICEGPYCADSTMHGCPNEACKLWLHPECLIDDVLTKVHARYVGNSEVENGKKKGPKPKKPKKNYAGKFKAAINFPNIEITDIRKGGDQGIWTETLTCPKCQTELD